MKAAPKRLEAWTSKIKSDDEKSRFSDAPTAMKVLTLNWLTCARRACKQTAASFPLHASEVELEQIEADMNPLFLKNMMSRLDWEAMKGLVNELGLPNLPQEAPSPDELNDAEGEPTQMAKDLHTLLMETSIANGKLVCGNCGHEYAVKDGIANFLLPSHMNAGVQSSMSDEVWGCMTVGIGKSIGKG